MCTPGLYADYFHVCNKKLLELGLLQNQDVLQTLFSRVNE